MARKKVKDLNPNYLTDTKYLMEVFSKYERRIITGESPRPTEYDIELLRNMCSRISNMVIIFDRR